MAEIEFKDVLKAFKTQLSRIEDAKNKLHNLEEDLDKILKQIHQELLKTKADADGNAEKWESLFSDLVYDWQDGLNYIIVGQEFYQFVFIAETLEINDFRGVKPTIIGKKEVKDEL